MWAAGWAWLSISFTGEHVRKNIKGIILSVVQGFKFENCVTAGLTEELKNIISIT